MIAEVKYGPAGPSLLLCGVEVHCWLGTMYDPYARELAEKVNTAFKEKQNDIRS